VFNQALLPLRDPDGAVEGTVLHAVDVTERVRARQRIEVLAAELWEREEQLQGLIEATFDAVVIHEKGVILGVNEAWAEMFGYRAAETVGRSVVDFVAPESRDLVRRRVTGSYDKPYEVIGLRKDGARLHIEVFAQNTRYRGRAVRIVGLRDITGRKRAEEALTQWAEELARANAELEQFAYVASHDLQEPLRAVVSYLQLLERHYRDRLDERAHKYIGHAVEGGRRMQRLVTDLLAYSRVGRRHEPSATAGEEALAQALANLRAAIAESGAQVTHGPLPTVRADPTQLAQLLQNLVGNALKFRGEAAPRVHVWAEREEGGGAWRFGVRDNGPGIAPEHRERIFGLFQRLHGRGEYPGTGLGLAICRKVVERHGGRLWVESAPGQGATFHFTLPDHAPPA
jgi:PAS domain S-box-containing protein